MRRVRYPEKIKYVTCRISGIGKLDGTKSFQSLRRCRVCLNELGDHGVDHNSQIRAVI